MKVEWLTPARTEYLQILRYYISEVGTAYARKFADKVLRATEQFALFPESGVIKYGTLMGDYGFRALFIEKYVCIYKVENDAVYIYHFTDGTRNYIRNIFGAE